MPLTGRSPPSRAPTCPFRPDGPASSAAWTMITVFWQLICCQNSTKSEILYDRAAPAGRRRVSARPWPSRSPLTSCVNGQWRAVRATDRPSLLPKTPAWRGGISLARGQWQAGPVARLLASVEVVPVDDRLGRRAGLLLARSGASDVVDASVICLAQDGDEILTSDPADLLDLARASGTHLELIPSEMPSRGR
jgi:hypothetical protein